MAPPRLIAAALAVTALAGCVSLTPAERESAEEAQRFLDETSRAYGVQRVTLMLGSAGRGDAATIRAGGLITLNEKFLGDRDVRDKVLAHEMAHLILGHMDRPPESRDARERREIEADVQAVEILRRVRGMTEARAFALVTAYALALKKDLDGGGRVDAMGHGHPCLKVEGLIRAYPRQQAVLDLLQADPSLGRCP
ncbi:MAG TPA: hypothetical protein VJU81_03860 [Methylomirabilota bacterium]|nr:hypothetical protein [Methylomirabilota bacterium]